VNIIERTVQKVEGYSYSTKWDMAYVMLLQLTQAHELRFPQIEQKYKSLFQNKI